MLTRLNLPDDVPIEAKMVTRAIKSAQTQVEQQNFEVRKNVLKYDEVMNEQRKVIYARRRRIIEGEDLAPAHHRRHHLRPGSMIRPHCPSDFHEEWDLDGLLTEARLYFPTQQSVEPPKGVPGTDALYEALVGEAIEFYEKKEQSMPAPPDGDPADTMRQFEREIMLQLIDQRWREHLSEMDYLREGINLRAMGQRDPLVEWQRDGYEMFGQMMSSIDDDYVKYVMHAQVQVMDRPAIDPAWPERSTSPRRARSGPVRPSPAPWRPAPPPARKWSSPLRRAPVPWSGGAVRARTNGDSPVAGSVPPVRVAAGPSSEFDRAGRNDPCPCGSGKKFKFCHGK